MVCLRCCGCIFKKEGNIDFIRRLSGEDSCHEMVANTRGKAMDHDEWRYFRLFQDVVNGGL